MAAIGHVFTIARVAEMPGQDEDWLHEISTDMFPEDGCLWVLGRDNEQTVAFTEFGVECLSEAIHEEKQRALATPGKPPK